jgi:hypothetical protein
VSGARVSGARVSGGKRLLPQVLLVALPLVAPWGAFSQQRLILREAAPADEPMSTAPPPDDTITATPLPPPDMPPPSVSPYSQSTPSQSPGTQYPGAQAPSSQYPTSQYPTAQYPAPQSPGTQSAASPVPPKPRQLVPNPLDDPNSVPAPGGRKETQQQGQPERGGWTQMGTATLQALDKINARGDTLVVKVGDVGHFGSLDIAVRGCFVRPPDVPADATAFLIIRDERSDKPAFSGWMVRSAPYMSMLAHPIYDVRVVSCAP